MIIKRLIATAIILAGGTALGNTVSAEPADSTSLWKYVPTIHGTIRAMYELSAENGESRFLVRNARLSAGGFVLPKVDYLLQVDFCDRGKIELLDAYVRIAPVAGLKIMAGQMRVPFSVDAARSPHTYYFLNRSFIGKHAGTLRSVGIKAGYTFHGVPVYVEGGVFNASSRTDHTVWNSALTYGIKANLPMRCGLTPQLAFMSHQPGGRGNGRRINAADLTLTLNTGNWIFEAEYLMANCTGPYPTTHKYNFFASHRWDVRLDWLNRLSAQVRFDGHTNATDGYTDSQGEVSTTWPARKRLTLGGTAGYSRGKVFLDFKLNYEFYFYNGDVAEISPAENDKLSAGFILHF